MTNERSDCDKNKAMSIYNQAVVVDMLTYAPTLNPKYLEDLSKSGVTATSVTVMPTNSDQKRALSHVGNWMGFAEMHKIRIGESTNDLKKSKKDGKVCVIMSSQNAKFLEDEIGSVRIFHKLGLRIIQLAYSEQNYLGSGGEDNDTGVSILGRKMIDAMNRFGILIDVSHCTYKTVMDAIKYSEKPVAITHANPKKIIDHHRNKSDEEMIACAEKGGIVGLTAWSPLSIVKQGKRPTLDDFMDFIDYVVNLVGEDHVGFGLDFTPNWNYNRDEYEKWAKEYPMLAPSKFEERLIDGIDDVSKVKNICFGLVKRGYSDEAIIKILGGNAMRVLEDVWI